jgi:hypothetical protein
LIPVDIPYTLVHAQRQLQRLELATQCFELGARIHTISILTGLPPKQLHTFLRPPENLRGRRPDTREWYHSANLPARVEASAIVSLFLRLNAPEHPPQAVLRSVYRHYAASCRRAPRISFDRAFDLIARSTGRWIPEKPEFSLFACPVCHCEYLTSLTDIAPLSNGECPFCKLLRRYHKDARLQASYPTRALPAEIPFYPFGPVQPLPPDEQMPTFPR